MGNPRILETQSFWGNPDHLKRAGNSTCDAKRLIQKLCNGFSNLNDSSFFRYIIVQEIN